ncbi:molecular chaperone [Morganella psychrotolerans]|uniref:Molecular chaperone n=1 Tax=Morganella psychrotolerans TaxID=368603 RepID=A0A1B8HK85_9GAMM|nr:molecular chaperone [Morganella psychrotolerans]OBU09643.1 molecular chaperone [Morganella psychrotolerans]
MQKVTTLFCAALATLVLTPLAANAAIALDRTRVIYNEGDKSVPLTVTNEHLSKPYLAQSWIENSAGQKITSPVFVTPPVQRIEANSKSQIKVQLSPEAASLPADRESVFYLNIREIPPAVEKSNVLQIALQTKIKLFYRPKAIQVQDRMETIEGAQGIRMTQNGGQYTIDNTTAFHLSVTRMEASGGKEVKFSPIMVAPKSSATFSAPALGNTPTAYYVNDYGDTKPLKFSCNGNTCSVQTENK